MNADKVTYVDPMAGTNSSTCVVKMLLVSALRYGRVPFTTIEEVLAAAALRHDHKIVWSSPDEPVLFSLGRSRDGLDLKKPVTEKVMNKSLDQMALNAGVMAVLHDVRRGKARGTAHTKKTVLGVPNRTVANNVDHTVKALNSGVTENYIGHNQTKTFNMIAGDPLDDRLAPKCAPPGSITKFSGPQLKAYMDKKGLKYSPRSHANTLALEAMRPEELDKFHSEGQGVTPLYAPSAAAPESLDDSGYSSMLVDSETMPPIPATAHQLVIDKEAVAPVQS
ncbi:unnamed protein product [Zymoseptoria tritici ST99CH_1A5]|uniref:Uncharacterized protein n=1 Tax=Zymoseptoria tritici ST99CH_1A5 TaxID=1276529 RepID=A0A1Y6LA00_ZYMTR|nr:unnamed protein product [Zymoseptoria tritici ST99CH_1A5]